MEFVGFESTRMRCPVCRAEHPKECGMKVYVEAECPVCNEQAESIMAIPYCRFQ